MSVTKQYTSEGKPFWRCYARLGGFTLTANFLVPRYGGITAKLNARLLESILSGTLEKYENTNEDDRIRAFYETKNHLIGLQTMKEVEDKLRYRDTKARTTVVAIIPSGDH